MLIRERKVVDEKTGKEKVVQNKSRVQASFIMGIPKKTLDDNVLMVRQGIFFGFDFRAYRDKPNSFLRHFVDERKLIYKKTHGVQKVESGYLDQMDPQANLLHLFAQPNENNS
mmetsp:Transcript_12726/g.21451  ORF Transcript_12726/g.21451 Transcript_12726/m.21451 type:complete len:113 (-) Transcript_12726:33-371(-)